MRPKSTGIKIAALAVVLFLSASAVYAETVVLKSGETIEGEIIERAGKYIKIDVEGVAVPYFIDDIESIDGQKQMPVPAANEPALEPQIMETSQDNAVQEGNIEQVVPLDVISATDAPVQEPLWQKKPNMQQTSEYAAGPIGQIIKALPPEQRAMFMKFAVFFIVLSFMLYVYSSICLQQVAKKTAKEPSWWAWVPIANLFLTCKIGGVSYLCLLVMFASLVPIIGNLCVAGLMAYLWYKIAVVLNKPGWLGVLVIIPVVNLVMMGYLAFSKD